VIDKNRSGYEGSEIIHATNTKEWNLVVHHPLLKLIAEWVLRVVLSVNTDELVLGRF
jgi:hypothetical protein